MYKVFTEDKVLFLDSFKHYEVSNPIKYEKNRGSKYFYTQVSNAKQAAIHIDISELGFDLQSFKNEFRWVRAAGGLVLNNGCVLMIYRHGKWDFPKGWIEKKESESQAALREVLEECGALSLNILSYQAIVTQHLYQTKKDVIWKETSWFVMNAGNDFELTPQIKEGVTRVCFVRFDEVMSHLEDSYPLLRDLWLQVSDEFLQA